ncbi:MAG TPA: hotdog domain-containing protein [Dehalococcoidia bacterium]|nr:hotdog domain-containing protein [Dehalococcoidia bacterium]
MAADAIKTGIRNETTADVTTDMVPRHLQGTTAQVLGTPTMIGLMEGTCHRSIADLLAENQRSVGYEVHVRHLAPAPVGSTVRITSELVEVEGNKLAFHVEVYEGDRKIGEGTIRRAVIEHRGFGQKA